jgi:tRNA pseudouridine55 synthase
MRRVLRERRIGHTGTLDPIATGVLPLVVGRATRLARFLSAADKSYEAVIHLGFATDTGDADGSQIGARYDGPLPLREAIDRTLDAFRGQFLQQPPAFSAKKIAGRRSYDLARGGQAAVRLRSSGRGRAAVRLQSGSNQAAAGEERVRPAAATVTAHAIEILSVVADQVTLRIDCSAGFYVRSLAHDLGERLGTGAHLVALRRTRSGEHSLADTLPLDTAERDPDQARQRVVPLARMLTQLPAISLDPDAVRRTLHGRDLESSESPQPDESEVAGPESRFVRLLDADGDLVAIAERTGASGLLHPSVVLR